jgi:formyltetrahydrofolate-dependent phosphoribosylglycinamide formyltransferase
VPLRVAVLLSGEGTSLENLFEYIDAGLPARVEVVIASKPRAGGLARAAGRGVPALAVPRRDHPDVAAFNDALHAHSRASRSTSSRCSASSLRVEPRERFAGRVINVHPALIPAFSGQGFYGHRVHEAVLEAGVKVTGATVHFADAEYDHGPIILQEAVPVRDDDTPESLAARVQAAERRIVPEAIRLIAEGRLAVRGAPGADQGRRIAVDCDRACLEANKNRK